MKPLSPVMSLSSFSDKPGQPDCADYLRHGACKYGEKCRFNHPVLKHWMHDLRLSSPVHEAGVMPDGPVQSCKKMGEDGKLGHWCKIQQNGSRDEQPILNFFNLPIRLGVKSCAFYLRTGWCKFGVSCKFHHPEPVFYQNLFPLPSVVYTDGIQEQVPSPGGQVVGGASPMYMPGSLPYIPVFVPLQNMIPWSTWNTCQVNGAPLSVQQQHLVDSSMLQQSENAMSVAKVATPNADSNGEGLLPEKPGQPNCHHFIRTGHCKFGPDCRYNHPKDMALPSLLPALSIMGLPLRPGQPLCSFYVKNGICKFGPLCKFDHPISPQYASSEKSMQAAFPRTSLVSSVKLDSPQESQHNSFLSTTSSCSSASLEESQGTVTVDSPKQPLGVPEQDDPTLEYESSDSSIKKMNNCCASAYGGILEA